MPPFHPPRHGSAWPRSTTPAGESLAAFARAHECPWPRSLYYPDGRYVGIVEWNEIGPWSDVTGPVIPRGGPAGLALQGGKIIAEWGDIDRCDMTFSVAKSYLAILAGLAVADGLIPSIDDPVGRTVKGPWFESDQNVGITWRHFLQLTSEWQGEIWGKSDQVDHNRQLGTGADNSRKGHLRGLKAPGTHFEYNDVRVNVLAFCLMQRFGRALPDVLRERIMVPIGASDDWQWHGYSNSWIELGGRWLQSVSGGAHWGGGMFISARDQARLGLLVARRGNWAGQQLVPVAWIEEMLRPSVMNNGYGLLWWLNTGRAKFPSAPETSVFALGAGGNVIWVDGARDLVTVMRWMDAGAQDEFLRQLSATAG
jgi:CubicO group peptidase (beta-lactamase class C family)